METRNQGVMAVIKVGREGEIIGVVSKIEGLQSVQGRTG
jgi:hypothetical protein